MHFLLLCSVFVSVGKERDIVILVRNLLEAIMNVIARSIMIKSSQAQGNVAGEP